MDNPQQEKNEKIIPQWGWIKDLLFPIVNTIFGTILVILIANLNKPKTGELHILCNINSAEVFLDEEYKGITTPIDKDHQTFVLKINSVYPGSYQIKLKKDTLYNGFISDVVVNPGYRTSKYLELTRLKSEFRNMDKGIKLQETKNGISPRKIFDKEKHIKVGLEDKSKNPNLPEQKMEKTATNDTTAVLNIKKQITRRLTIRIEGKIPLEKVNFFVNSSLMGTPSSHQFTIELPEGKNVLTFTYSDAIGNNYRYSKTKNIYVDESLFIEKNEFDSN